MEINSRRCYSSLGSEDTFCAICHAAKHHTALYRFGHNAHSEVWYCGLDAQWADTNDFRLLILAFMCGDRYLDIVGYYIEKCDLATILSGQHILSLSLWNYHYYSAAWIKNIPGKYKYVFDCSIIDIFAQLAFCRMEAFCLFLRLGDGIFNPSQVLITHLESHYRCDACLLFAEEKEACIINWLLEQGADPNGACYYMMPLQIAVYEGQANIVAQLLAAGADPNRTGDSEGFKWEGNTILGHFVHFHGHSPLDLIESGIQAECGTNIIRKITNEQMCRLRKQYGATAISVREDSTTFPLVVSLLAT